VRVQDQTFLVTGGASGLGAATARRLAAAGARVLIVDRDSSAGEKLVREIGAPVRFVPADVTDEPQMRAAVDAAVAFSDGTGLRGLIHCAGIVWGEKLLGRDGPHALDTFVRVLQVNLVGTFNTSRLAAVAIAKAAPDDNGERGVIIHTSSVAASEGQIGQAAYAASKGGVAAMTLPMARELAKNGIRVMAIAPGMFETPMVAGFPEPVRESLMKQVVFPPRLGNPDEFAALVQHIIENPMLNGCVVRLDGAVRLPAR